MYYAVYKFGPRCAETQIEVSCVRPKLKVFTNIKEELTRRRVQA